jgi:L-seryl-tRNA(Ser) seleniumtransferase|tara:strand:- start:23490 stop:24872 length:1383 start_codon:yes stop_codon:yes gene_type:complete
LKLHDIPSVNSILESLSCEEIDLPRGYISDIVRRELTLLRNMARNGKPLPDKQAVLELVRQAVAEASVSGFSQVINGTGIVLHTGLGRAPLSKKFLSKVAGDAAGYTALEVDLATGKRGERLHHIEPLLSSLTGAESVLVVNNNAAAVLLALNSLAERKEVIISRGQMVEIGGSFRIPEVVAKSGARLVEIGTTNRTHFRDYEKSVSKDTGAILVVHTSNYRVLGFTNEVATSELSVLARKKRVPLIVDLGSGALFDLQGVGLPAEPVAVQMVKQGADLITFSGDKLLGGPQAGVIAGRKSLIVKLHRNPLYRALRCDKMTLLLLEQTMHTFRDMSVTKDNLTFSLLTTASKTLRRRGNKLLTNLSRKTVNRLGIELVETEVEAGSGSLPTETLDSVALKFNKTEVKPSHLARRFRQSEPPVLGYISGNRFFIDLKAVLPDHYSKLKTVLEKVARGDSGL